MAMINGLQSPNPYAQAAYKASARVRTAVSAEDLGNRAVSSNSSSYSPDWMQGDHAAAVSGATPALYGAKGEPLKLPQSVMPANDS